MPPKLPSKTPSKKSRTVSPSSLLSVASVPSATSIALSKPEILEELLEEIRDRSPSKSPSPCRVWASRLTEELVDKIANKKKYLILDLDATLLWTLGGRSSLDPDKYSNNCLTLFQRAHPNVEEKEVKEFMSRFCSFSYGGDRRLTIIRQRAFDFIEFIRIYFTDVAIWSAGDEGYVNEVLKELFTGQHTLPFLIMTWKDCASVHREDPVTKLCYLHSLPKCKSERCIEGFTKPLELAAEKWGPDVNLSNLILLDDRADNAADTPDNLIQIPCFEGLTPAQIASNKDFSLDWLTQWLVSPEVLMCDDYRTLNKSNIFSRHRIDPRSVLQ